jgi:hypothetical protein
VLKVGVLSFNLFLPFGFNQFQNPKLVLRDIC